MSLLYEMGKFSLKSWRKHFHLNIYNNKTKDFLRNMEAGGVLPVETLFTKTDLLFERYVWCLR